MLASRCQLYRGPSLLPGDIEPYLAALEEHVLDPHVREWPAKYAPEQAPRIRSDVDLVLSMKPQSVLNVGGAPFVFEHLLQQRAPGIRVTSIDIAPERLGGLTKALSINVLRGDIERETVTNQKFDAVVFNEVIEHCRLDLIGTVQRLASMLNDGGHLFVATPNGRSLQNIYRNLLGRTGPQIVSEWRKMHDLGHMGHVREYSRIEMEELFAHCGLRVCRMLYRRHPASHSVKARIASVIEAVIPPVRHNMAFVLQREDHAVSVNGDGRG